MAFDYNLTVWASRFCLLLFVITALAGCKKETHTPFVCNTAVSYTSHAKAILDAHCAIGGCHTGPYPAGGIFLSDYTNAKVQVLGDDLLCSIRQEVNCTPMPYPLGSAPLSDSLINILVCWRNNGCPQ